MIFLLMILFTVPLSAVVSPGENLWQMVKEVGQQVDTIATLAAGGSGGCVFSIKQADVASVTYTISQPGLYCLAEDLSAAHSGTIIDIRSSNVVLDFNHHTITGNNTSTAIIMQTSVNHVAIQNGTIRSCNRSIVAQGTMNALLIFGMQIYNSSFNTILLSGTLSNALIDQCHFVNNSGSSLAISGIAIQNIIVQNSYFTNTTGIGAVTISGITNFYMNNCVTNRINLSISSSNGLISNVVRVDDGQILLGSGFNNVVDHCASLGNFSTLGSSTGSYATNGSTNSIIKDSFNVSTGSCSVFLGGSSSNPTVKKCIVMGTTTGMNNSSSTNSEFYANVAHGNTTNYTGVTVAPVVTTPTAATSFWANVN